jgi:UDP-glucose 6-dehydrogenase
VDYSAVKAAAVLRKNIPDSYLDVNEILRGYGGTCLPKDTEAFATHAEHLAPHYKLFRTLIEENKLFPPTVFNGMRNQNG